MRTARVKVTRVNVNVESRSTSTFTRAFQAFRLFFNTRVNFTYVRRKEKHVSVCESVVWVVLACVIMWSNPYKTETTLERCCVVFCFAVFFCEVCSVWLFFSSDKAFKGMSNPYICCIIVVAVVDCLDLNSVSYIHLSCLQSNKLIIFKNEITICSTWWWDR